MKINEGFHRLARWCANALGSPVAFVSSCVLIVAWLASGALLDYSDTWQLLVNTITTVLTYLAVFLIQNTQNHDAKAMHLKLDELIRSVQGARNRFVDLEELTDEELQALQAQFQRLQKEVQTTRRDVLLEKADSSIESDRGR
jgi:low affinity Fe/Cu permease